MSKKTKKYPPSKSAQKSQRHSVTAKLENFDMGYYLDRYPPPLSQVQVQAQAQAQAKQQLAPQRNKSKQHMHHTATANVKRNSNSETFDMNAALQLYPPKKPQACQTHSPAQDRRKKKQQSKAELYPKSTAASRTDTKEQWHSLLADYAPSTDDLCAKIAAEEQGEIQYKGQQQQYRRSSLKQRKIDDQIDLHGMLQEEARKQLKEFLHRSIRHGKRKVLIIHGKGHHSHQGQGVLQKLVTEFLLECKAANKVEDFSHPAERNGGKGATVALLRSKSRLKR